MTWSARFVGHAEDPVAEGVVVKALQEVAAKLDLHEGRFFGIAHNGDLANITPAEEPVAPVPDAPPPEPAPVEEVPA